MWSDFIITREPQIIQSVLATNFNDFGKGPIIKVRLVVEILETATMFLTLG